MTSRYVVRIDGDVTKDAELLVRDSADAVLPLVTGRQAARMFSMLSVSFNKLAAKHGVPRFRGTKSSDWLCRLPHLEALARKLIPGTDEFED